MDIVQADISGFRFVLTALAKADHLPFHHKHLMIQDHKDGSRAMATDGSRVHIYTYDHRKYETGFYIVTKNKVNAVELIKTDHEGPYPEKEIDKLVRQRPKNIKVDQMQMGLTGFYTRIARAMPEEFALDIKYIGDLLPFGNWAGKIVAQEKKPCRFECKNRMALIMKRIIKNGY